MKTILILSVLSLFVGCASKPQGNSDRTESLQQEKATTEKETRIPERARFALDFMETITKENYDAIGNAERLKFMSDAFIEANDIKSSEVTFNRHTVTHYEFAGISGEYVDVAIRLSSCKMVNSCWFNLQQYYRFKVIDEAGGFAIVPYLYKDGFIHPWRSDRHGASGFVDTSISPSPEREAFVERFMETRLETAMQIFTDEERFNSFSETYLRKYGIDKATANMGGHSGIDSYKILNSFGEFVDVQLIFDNPFIAHETRVVRLKVIDEGDSFALEPHQLFGKTPKYIPYWWVKFSGTYDL